MSTKLELCSICMSNRNNIDHLFFDRDLNVYICNLCIYKLYHYQAPISDYNVNPMTLAEKLNNVVIGQEDSIKNIVVSLFKHSLFAYKKIDPLFAKSIKSNVLLIGPTGVGKTYMVEYASKILDVPFISVDCASLTASGYVGNDVESILSSLIKKTDYNISRA